MDIHTSGKHWKSTITSSLCWAEPASTTASTILQSVFFQGVFFLGVFYQSVIFTKCIFQKCIFPKCICPTCIFPKCICPTCIFPKCILLKILQSHLGRADLNNVKVEKRTFTRERNARWGWGHIWKSTLRKSHRWESRCQQWKVQKKYFDERERFPLIFLSPDLSATEKVFLPERDFPLNTNCHQIFQQSASSSLWLRAESVFCSSP